MKRIFSLLLTFAIILSMSIPAMASEIEAVPYTEEMAGDVFFYDAETGEITGENVQNEQHGHDEDQNGGNQIGMGFAALHKRTSRE